MRVDLGKGQANVLISPDELKQRQARLAASGGYRYPASQTPWQELYRQTVGQHATGACLELATRYQDIAVRFGVPRITRIDRSSISSAGSSSRWW